MFDLKEINKKLKLILKGELGDIKITNKDVAQSLNINYNTYKQHIHKNRIPFKEIMLFCAKRKISINWLFFEQLPETLIKPTQDIVVLKYNNIYASLGKGIENYELEPLDIVIDKLILDSLNADYKYTELIKASGDSMEPLVPDGAFVFIDKSKKELINNRIYAFLIGKELYIKQVIKKDKAFLLRSTNKEYEDIFVENIKIVGKVTGVLYKT